MIKAIETEYAGCKFRSRLEARWAVFFDAVDWEWNYEPEGFELEDGERYLPDFYLPDFDIYCEVKPNIADRSEELFRAFKFLKGGRIRAIIILPEMPSPHNIDSVFWYKVAYYNNLTRNVCVERAVFGQHGKSDVWIGDDRWVGRRYPGFYDVDYCIKNKVQFDWAPVHDEDMPYSSDGDYPFKEFSAERTPTLNEAYGRARQARFEHGETPKR